MQGTPLASSCAPLTSESSLVLKFQKETELKVGKSVIWLVPSPLPTPPGHCSHCRERGQRESCKALTVCRVLGSPVLWLNPPQSFLGDNFGGILEDTRTSFRARRGWARLRSWCLPSCVDIHALWPGLGRACSCPCCPPHCVCIPNRNTLGRHCLPPH